MPRTLHRHRLRNLALSGALLLAMAAVLALVGWLLGGAAGVAWTLGLAGAFALFAPRVGPERLMRAHRARPLHPTEAPGLVDAVRTLSERAGIAPPRLYLVPLPVPQAFATTSGGESAIGISPALLTNLSPREAVAVIAHEISHLRHRDLWVMRLAETVRRLTGTTSTLGLLLVLFSLPLWLLAGVQVPWLAVALLLVAPWAVGLLSLALSRARELDADVGAVALTRDPVALARALTRIEAAQRGPWWMRLFAVELPEWMRTHPSTERRVARLAELAQPAHAEAAPRRERSAATRPVVSAQREPRVVQPVWLRVGPRPPAPRRFVIG